MNLSDQIGRERAGINRSTIAVARSGAANGYMLHYGNNVAKT
jgi:hypothetical protein